MSQRRILVIILTILTGIDIGLLWNGGGSIMADVAIEEFGPNDTFGQSESINSPDPSQSITVRVRSPKSIIDELTAAGTVELVSKRQVVLEIDGIVNQVPVKVGDQVASGDLIIALDTTDRERAVSRAEIDLESARAELSKLQEKSGAGEIAVAEANLHAAQENLAKVQAGATAEELAAAQSKLAAARAKYSETVAPPSSAAIDEARAAAERADIARKEAQRAYDKVKWRNDVGVTPESAQLQKATIDYEQALAKLNRVNVPSSQSSVQNAASSIQQAEHELEQLKLKPTAADLADAQAKVADTEQRLTKLKSGPSSAAVQSAEARIKKALIDIEEAQAKLQKAQVLSPISGTVLELKVTPGARGTVGTVVATLADTSQLKLSVKVAEVDIPRITVGQEATVSIDALRGVAYKGIVEHIAPTKNTGQDVVSYPVTIRLIDAAPDGVRPGMNAVATLANSDLQADSWLVPTNALQMQDGANTTVMVKQGDIYVPVTVTPGEAQGEWTVVQSTELSEGAEVVGYVASFINQQNELGGEFGDASY